jgi:hypothetical protein
MRKLSVAIVAAAALSPAAIAQAKPTPRAHSGSSANQACHQLRHDLGVAKFRLTYGTNHNHANAMGKCRSAERQALRDDQSNAATSCKAERAEDPGAFADKYGTGKKGRNALGKCVSQTASASATARHEATENAARACRRERADDPGAFADKYGTGKRKRNAFGKCVSAAVKTHTT